MFRKPKVALVIFNTISQSTSEFWGNLQISLLSGELQRQGIDNDIFLLLQHVGDAARNRSTIGRFVSRIRNGAYDVVYFDRLWLPLFREKLQAEAPGARIVCGSEAQDVFPKIAPQLNAAYTRFTGLLDSGAPSLQPNFKYIILGAGKKTRQTVVDMLEIESCSYQNSLEANSFYHDLSVSERKAHRGCSYCGDIPREDLRRSPGGKELFLYFMSYFQEHLAGLERISLPHPENYFPWLAEQGAEMICARFRPVKFHVQLRPDVIIRHELDVKKILSCFHGTGFGLTLATVGFENFSGRELKILNRGYGPGVISRALKIVNRLCTEFPESLDMSIAMASFILFNPYTRRDDVVLNIKRIRASNFMGFRSININRARIRPGVGLYALALKHGLVRECGGSDFRLADLPRGGYHGDYEYRFADPAVERIYRAFAEAELSMGSSFEKHKMHILNKIVELAG